MSSESCVLPKDRIEMLSLLLETVSQCSGWCPEHELLPKGVCDSFTEMLAYKGSGGTHSIFVDIYSEDNEYEVWLPQPLKEYLRPNDTFLMTLGRREKSWAILFSSPPYEFENIFDEE